MSAYDEMTGEQLVVAAMKAIEAETGNHPNGFYLGWSVIGPMIKRNNIMLCPPTSPVHRNGGPNAGNGVAGDWSATTFHRGKGGRRAIAHHENDPLIAALRCYIILWLDE